MQTSAGHDEPPDSYDTYSHSVPLFSQCSEEMVVQVPQAEANRNLYSLTDAQINVIDTAAETQLLSQCSTTNLDIEKMNADGYQSNETNSKNISEQHLGVNTDTENGSRCKSISTSAETQTEVKVFVDSATSPITIELLRTQLIPGATINKVQSKFVLNDQPVDATYYNYDEFRTDPDMPAQFYSEHVVTVLSCKQESITRPRHIDNPLESQSQVNEQRSVTIDVVEAMTRPSHIDNPQESHSQVNEQRSVTIDSVETICGNYSLRSRVLK